MKISFPYICNWMKSDELQNFNNFLSPIANLCHLQNNTMMSLMLDVPSYATKRDTLIFQEIKWVGWAEKHKF